MLRLRAEIGPVATGTGLAGFFLRLFGHRAGDAPQPASGSITVEAMIAALEAGSPGTRREAARALGDAGDARAVEPLTLALGRSRDFHFKEQAITALGKLGDPRAVDPLIAKLKDRGEDFYLRKKAAYTLYAIYRQGRLDAEAREKVLSLWHSWYLL